MIQKEYDVMIVGTGAAGLYAALQFEKDVRVLLVCKKELTLSNSSLAQGGVAAVIDKNHDDFKLHIADTLISGGYKNDLSSLEVLVTEGPDDVLHLKDLGVDFDLDDKGQLQMTLEAGHSRRRIVHHKDSTGRAIVDKLLSYVTTYSNIDILENAMLFSLHPAENGFYAEILHNDEALQIGTRFCLLATGGIGRVYEYTTNSAIATGDGITIAHELGAEIKHLSWIQFHPTAFAADKGRERFLISEAVRGEGAVLLNCDGERFAHNYDPRGELAPRDVVSRAIMLESRRTRSENFYLDITEKDPDFVRGRFPMIYERCLEEGIDITRDRIPVFPCQHYLMGGVNVDLMARTAVPRLYAAGECSHTGVHGINRLASNSLLEALVFSRRAAQDMMARLTPEERSRPIGPAPAPTDRNGLPLPHGLRTEIRSIMQRTHFVLPAPELVPEGYRRVRKILDQLLHGGYAVTPDYIEAKSLATVASLILKEVDSHVA